MEERVDELGSQLQELRELLLEQVVVVLIFASSQLKVLLDLTLSTT